MDAIVKQAVYLAGRMGVDHVAIGSDFDGTRIPDELGSVEGLPRLVEALRGEFSDDATKIVRENWLRVLTQTWEDTR